MRTLFRSALLVAFSLAGAVAFAAAERVGESATVAPVDAAVIPLSSVSVLRYEWDATSGVLWHVGGGASPLNYVITPLIISVKLPPISEHPFAGGLLIHRTRISLLVEPFAAGPEHHFFGVAAAGDLEWKHPGGRFSAFFAGGGGFGWMDSKGYEVRGGQGQDFNLNWLLHTGVRYQTPTGWRCALGLYFQHLSNRGMDKVNPGINALGPTIGLSRRF